MDGFINSSIEKQTIYEIYRACRLCGAGAGYKMPIMQNVVHLDGAEVELRQKIRECVQIEVHQEDKMPPLICELCVDKVNDFYEFLEMCRQTNNRTRLRLGLPLQTMSKGAPDAGDCILGVTEPVYLNEDSNESLLKPRARNKGKFAKEAGNFKKNKWQNEVRSLRSKHVSPPPQRSSKRSREEDMSLSKLQKTRSSMAMPKSILRKERENKVEEDWSPTRSKRSRDSRDIKLELPKRVKIVEKAVTSKPSVKSDFKCKTCKIQFNSNKALTNHMRTHNRPQPKYKSTSKQEKSFFCSKCQKDFQSKLGLGRHKCISANKCGNCGRHITNVRNLANHERACRSKNEFKISPKLLKQLRPIQIRVKRCDQILKKVGDSYDVSGVDCNFGLDKNCIYPYLRSLRIKTEPSYMVNIHNTIDEFDLNQDYVHWDSDSCESDLEISDLRQKNVETLAKLSLRTIFSHKFLGKVPKRKRRVKPHKAHDSLLNFDSDVRLGIDNIINSLDNDRNVNDTKDNDNDSLFGDDKTPAVSNDDFDSLFTSTNDSESNLSGDMRKSDEKCEIGNKINEIENKNITEVNNDNVTKLESNDTIENTQENVERSESSEVVSDTVNISSKNNDNEEHTDKESLINNKTIDDSEVKDNEEIILINNDKVDSNEEQSCNSTNNEMTERTGNVIKNNESVLDSETEKHNEINDKDQDNNIPVSKSDIPIALVPNIELSGVNDENNDSPNNDNTVNDPPVNVTLKNNDNKIDKTLHVNGDDKLDLDDLEDISDSEMDDSRLMDAIDEQIGEKKIDTSQVDEESSLSREISVVKSTDLESISSEELPNE